MPNDTREPAEIMEHVIRSRVNLTAAIYGLSQEQLLTPGVVGRWTIKEVMAHIGRWEAICLHTLRDHIEGKPGGFLEHRDILAYNDQWEAELSKMTLLSSIMLFEQAHYQLFGFLAALQQEQWDSYVKGWVVGSCWQHFEEHTAQIFTWRVAQETAALASKSAESDKSAESEA